MPAPCRWPHGSATANPWASRQRLGWNSGLCRRDDADSRGPGTEDRAAGPGSGDQNPWTTQIRGGGKRRQGKSREVKSREDGGRDGSDGGRWRPPCQAPGRGGRSRAPGGRVALGQLGFGLLAPEPRAATPPPCPATRLVAICHGSFHKLNTFVSPTILFLRFTREKIPRFSETMGKDINHGIMAKNFCKHLRCGTGGDGWRVLPTAVCTSVKIELSTYILKI